MVTRADILVELRKVPEKYLDELYQIIKDFESRPVSGSSDENVMAALRRIKISASPDFSIKSNL